ncbi:hypothetical protein ACPPVO_05455 [Dactylosporangium sp. McL0621]|uniref:hypothetical protein n=1 Tax=Dactylosporangium sp. McL0621 TaxID=3415678 RepID=UPI003CECF554
MTALLLLTWLAIALLFLALGATVRSLRLLRARVDRHATEFAATRTAMRIAGTGTARIVLAADSGCPLCGAVAERLSRLADRLPAPLSLMTYEQADAWAGRIDTDRLPVVSDPVSWQEIAHLSPPVLLLVAADGEVQRLFLPVDVAGVDRVLNEWSLAMNRGVEADAVHAGTDSVR